MEKKQIIAFKEYRQKRHYTLIDEWMYLFRIHRCA